MKRAWAVLAVMSLVAMQGWASGLFSKPATVVFLLDTTLTVQHFDAFRRAWIRTVAELRDGDHVVLAVVKGDARGGPGGAFPYLIERTMPAYSIWKPYEEYRKEKAAVEKELLAAFETALTVGRFDKTLLLSSVRSLAEHLASDAGGPRVIIIASDMLEDSEYGAFEQRAITPSFLSRLIADERNLLRDKLKGVEVHVVAAGAATDKKALEVRRFWEALFRATGARLTPSWYAGELIGLRL
jgi:hypothetical protein